MFSDFRIEIDVAHKGRIRYKVGKADYVEFENMNGHYFISIAWWGLVKLLFGIKLKRVDK